MPLTSLVIEQLRNLTALELSFVPNYNIFYGDNGSGKTSLLEAIYYLGLGRSFRTATATRVIQQGQSNLSIFGRLSDAQQATSLGIRRDLNGQREMKCDGERLTHTAALAKALPLQLINHQQQALLSSPKLRRQYLNWGLFHVEQSFFSSWQAYHGALKQRNAGLRQHITSEQLSPWNAILIKEASTLHTLREHYVKSLIKMFFIFWETLIEHTNNPLSITYTRGWPTHKTLEQALNDSFDSDRRLGYTQSGPHRADLQFIIDKMPAKDRLSQGQQKLLVYALKLAQGALLKEQTKKHCIYLIDDLPAELDAKKRARVAEILTALQSQVFITGISSSDFSDFHHQTATSQLFHVKHGHITPDCG